MKLEPEDGSSGNKVKWLAWFCPNVEKKKKIKSAYLHLDNIPINMLNLSCLTHTKTEVQKQQVVVLWGDDGAVILVSIV